MKMIISLTDLKKKKKIETDRETLTSIKVLVHGLEPADIIVGVWDQVNIQHVGVGGVT